MNSHATANHGPSATAAEKLITDLAIFHDFVQKTVTETVTSIPYLTK